MEKGIHVKYRILNTPFYVKYRILQLSLTITPNTKAPMRLAPGPSICSIIIKTSESFPLTERRNVVY